MEEARQHISKMMGEAGISHKVEPRGLFRGCFPPDKDEVREVMNALVSDFSINWPGGVKQKVAELKTCTVIRETSTTAVPESELGGAPVGARARAIPTGYKDAKEG